MGEFLSIENEGEAAKEVRIDKFRRIYNMTDDELFNQMERAARLSLKYQKWVGNGLGDFDFDESLQANIDMISRFRNDTRGISEISGNTRAMLDQDPNYTSYLNNLESNIRNKLSSVNNADEISGLSFTNLNRPTFNTGANFFNINSTWTINVSFENVKLDCDKFSGTLKIDIYDQFGLDNADLGLSETPHPSAWKTRLLDGMWAWFILQRVERTGGNYAPFINHFSDSITVETTIN
ncbi:DUF3289 family protein [Flavivirga rizhaonensis]|uniref:DUF3289 family protein n=1 Tax=Flavivirga rizhaonensis TaxID=2559571 RepID=A0A4S1DR38_9FLAO|nr:DUF3289 family protein [Flavivirga rizhaonensis]TGV00390.1 DUF3289 family protein [Flavivirga rizhaonensis]